MSERYTLAETPEEIKAAWGRIKAGTDDIDTVSKWLDEEAEKILIALGFLFAHPIGMFWLIREK